MCALIVCLVYFSVCSVVIRALFVCFMHFGALYVMFPETLKQAYLSNQLSVRDEPKNTLYRRRYVTICAIFDSPDLLAEEAVAGSKHVAPPVLGGPPIKN
jgi:hypothetical protein